MRSPPPLVVLVLGGVAERWACPEARSPLAMADTPHLDRLAAEGRVFGVRLVDDDAAAATAAPLLAILGYDPAAVETARASYIGELCDDELGAGECYVSANFVSLFRSLVADSEPGHLRPAEIGVLVGVAADAVARAGFRLRPGRGAQHVAIGQRASVDADTPPADALLGKELDVAEPRVAAHALAHRLARQALDGHEINVVRRDLGDNGADAVWMWGPGGPARLERRFEGEGACAFGTTLVWRGLCKAARLPVRAPSARTPAQLLRGLGQALKRERLCILHVRRGVRDALLRERRLRADGLTDLDRQFIGPVADAVAAAGGRLLVLPDAARDTGSGQPLADPVPVLVWGAGVTGLRRRRFTETGAAAAGDPIEPGHGLLAYVRHL